MRTTSHITFAALAALTCFAAQSPPSSAQTTADNAEVCYNEDNGYDFEEAVAACTALIQSGTETSEQLSWDFYNRGRAYDRLSDHARALADFNQVLQFDPHDAGAFYRRGLARIALGDRVNGVADLSEAVRLNPQFPGAAALLNRLVGSQARVFQDCAECPEMVAIPAGTFIMGAPPELANQPNSERPEHRVTIPQFAVSKNEITFLQWEACVAAGGCDDTTRSAYGNIDRGNGYRPLVNIDWNDAQTYVRWLSQRTGQGYRLLSEAEWEYAARAGTTTEFATGPSIAPSQANFGGQLGETRPVGSYPPNAFGLHDMHGNVAEWVEDCWNDSYSGAPSNGSAWIAGDCSQHVIRGGYHWDHNYNLRSSQRHPDVATSTIAGIRVARTVSAP